MAMVVGGNYDEYQEYFQEYLKQTGVTKGDMVLLYEYVNWIHRKHAEFREETGLQYYTKVEFLPWLQTQGV